MTPGTLDLRVQRWAPFIDTIAFEGFDFTGATFALQVRQYRDAAGSALISLTGATAGSQGISCVVTTDAGIPTSTLTIQIEEATIEGTLAYPGSGVKAGSDVTVYYDLVITGGGWPKTRWLQGTFTIEAGVTQ